MRNSLILLTAIIVGSFARDLRADLVADAASRARQISPYLDEQVLAVARMDLARADLKGASGWISETLNREMLTALEADVVQWIDAFRKGGGSEVYVVLSLADFPERTPFLIVPLREGAKEHELVDLLKRIARSARLDPFEKCERFENVLFAGSGATLERLRKHVPAPRPGLADAFVAAGDSTMQFLVVPSGDHRRVIREMLSQPPDEDSPPIGTILADGIHWLALGVDLPPKPALRWVIQSADAAAARQLLASIHDGTEALGRFLGSQGASTNIGAMLNRLAPARSGDRLSLTLDDRNQGIEALKSALRPAIGPSFDRFRRHQTVRNLKQVGLALHNYHEAYDRFPSRANFDAQKKPLLSWRVHLLPYIDEGKLYREFHLDEAWDSPHNRTLVVRMPDVYRNGNWRLGREGKTTFLAPIGESTMFWGREGVPLGDVKDGASSTIIVVDAADGRAVEWTRPEDWEFDPDRPLQGLVGNFDGGFRTLFCDGGVRFLNDMLKLETLRALFTRNGGETVEKF